MAAAKKRRSSKGGGSLEDHGEPSGRARRQAKLLRREATCRIGDDSPAAEVHEDLGMALAAANWCAHRGNGNDSPKAKPNHQHDRGQTRQTTRGFARALRTTGDEKIKPGRMNPISDPATAPVKAMTAPSESVLRATPTSEAHSPSDHVPCVLDETRRTSSGLVSAYFEDAARCSAWPAWRQTKTDEGIPKTIVMA